MTSFRWGWADRLGRGLFLIHFAICLAVAAFFYRPLFDAERAMNNSDLASLFWPGRLLATKAQADGVVPLWSEWQFFGAPFHAGLQGGALYPPLWVQRMLLGGGPRVEEVTGAIYAELLLHIFWMAAGVGWMLRREWGASREAALLAGLALAISGWMASHLGHANQIETTSWAPWIVGLARRLAREGRTPTALWLALAMAMSLLAGHPQGLYYALLFCAFCMPAWLRLGTASPGEAIRRVALFLLAGALALGLAGAQLLPALEATRHAWTHAEGEEYALHLAMPPIGFLGYLAPWMFGTPIHGAEPGFENWAFHEFTVYFGLGPLFLSLIGLGAALRGKWRPAAKGRHRELVPLGRLEALCMALAWLFAIGVSMGGKTPLFGWASEWLPLFGKLRAHARALLLGHLAMLVFAARGFDHLSGLLAAMRKPTKAERLAVRANPPRIKTITFLGFAAFLGGDLWLASWGADFRDAALFAPKAGRTAITEALRRDPRRHGEPFRVFWLIRDDLYYERRQSGHFDRAAQLTPNNNFSDGIEISHGYGESLRPTLRQRDLLYTFHRNFMSPAPDLDLFRLLNCSHVLTDISGPIELGGEPAAVLRRPGHSPLRLFRVDDPLPRVVTRKKALELSRPDGPNLAALLEAFDGAWRRWQTPFHGYNATAVGLERYLDEFAPSPEELAQGETLAGEVQPLGRPSWNRQRFAVKGGPAKNIYHVASVFPGWKLRRLLPNGAWEWLAPPEPVSAVGWRVDGPLDPGDYEFVYAPDSYEAGKALTGVAAAVWCCMAGFFWRRGRLFRRAEKLSRKACRQAASEASD